jgi:hypothetical protein
VNHETVSSFSPFCHHVHNYSVYWREEGDYKHLYGFIWKPVQDSKRERGNRKFRPRMFPGVAGFRLLVADDDARMSVSVVTPDKKEHALDYWNIITRSFSSLGDRAEWRVVKRKGMITPIALIVRVDSSEQENIEARTRLRELRWSRFTRVHSLRPTSAFQQLR